jgi:hypothetical protein
MTTRKEFIAAAASMPLIAAAPPSAQPAASSTPSPAPKKKKISAAARALAEQMRSFDSALSDKEIEKIASGIDDNLKLGAKVNPHGTALKNWDEPVTTFEVPS